MKVAVIGLAKTSDKDIEDSLPKETTAILVGRMRDFVQCVEEYAHAHAMPCELLKNDFLQADTTAMQNEMQTIFTSAFVLVFWDGVSGDIQRVLCTCLAQNIPHKVIKLW